jgi:hypothetical protein
VLGKPEIGGRTVKWSVGVQTEGDRVISREEIVELADAVATSSGVASGIGTNRYGATLVVEARSRDEAIEKATAEFTRAAAQAGLPGFPIVRVEAVGEDEDAEAGDGDASTGGGDASTGGRNAGAEAGDADARAGDAEAGPRMAGDGEAGVRDATAGDAREGGSGG